MTNQKTPPTKGDPIFERKVVLSKWALVFERFWPRFWLVFGVAAAFAFLSLFDVWAQLDVLTHKLVLGALALLTLLAFIFALRVPWPSREQAIHRIERISGVAHRPASTYEDTMTAPLAEPTTNVIWQAHRERMRKLLSKLRVGNPQPGTHLFDPMALRLAVMVGVVLLSGLAGRALPEKFAAAFDFESKAPVSTARLDAWITPPSYTRKPPLMLADGSGKKKKPANSDVGVLEIPTTSELIVRATGTDHAGLNVEVLTDMPEPKILKPKSDDPKASGESGKENQGKSQAAPIVSEVRHKLTKSGQVRILRGSQELGRWSFVVIPDEVPKIALSKEPERTTRGSMKLVYKVEDDYGVVAAVAKLQRVPTKSKDSKTSWAKENVLKGPRPPLERPPELSLQLPRAGATSAEAKTTLELGTHPWAGLPVIMTLEVKDVAGQVGQSRPLQFILPEREFSNPFARAVIEQRRKLVQDTRYREQVITALQALTIDADTFIKDPQVYLALRASYYRLQRDQTREGRNSVIEQLWFTALRIEDGDLSDAERRLKEAEERLAKALRDGASEEEIKQAMEQLRKALNEYMRQMQKQAEKDGEQPPGNNEDRKLLGQEDLQKMMKEIEEAARSGSREKAQQMLSELRDILDQLQSDQTASEQNQRNKEMQKKLDKLGNMIGDQKKLMDDTFEQRRRQQQAGNQSPGSPSGQENQGQHGQQRGSSQGQGRAGQEKRWSGQRSQRGQQQARGGQQGQQQQRYGGQQGRDGLGRRQRGLRDELNRMKRELNQLGMNDQGALNKAEQAMENAREALEKNRLGQAMQQQGRALDQMRESAQELAQQMMENGPQRYGQEQNERDPLGRPQPTRGPNQGNSVKVPDQIDRQRAREILEELRRRVGEIQRPEIELQYIERLLKRF